MHAFPSMMLVLGGKAEPVVGLADAAVGPMVVALRRYGASLKDYPSLAKYDETIRVSQPLILWLRQKSHSTTLTQSIQSFRYSVGFADRVGQGHDTVMHERSKRYASCVGASIGAACRLVLLSRRLTHPSGRKPRT